MMWMHNVRTYARTVGLGGEGRRVVKNSLKIFHTSAGDCPAVVVCCGRGVLFGDALDNFDARTDLDTRCLVYTSIECYIRMNRKWDDKKYVRPIPTTALNDNPALGQNPGWKK